PLAGNKLAREKSDRSPVTDADEEAEGLILAMLASHFPGVPVVAEEEAAAGRVAAVSERFFLVDPLDGTKEFLSGNGEFTVNIAEIEHGVPVAGAVYAPARARLFFGGAGMAFENGNAIAARLPARDGLVAVGSRSHGDAATDAFLKRWPVKSMLGIGSSLKFCLVAAGEADIYARGGPTMEWDTAAGHAVLLAAGGRVENWSGAPLLYGKPGFKNPAFVAFGKR
ncbi:MAG TPA: 3'(2'),5'-bisphosphate nucleotidase CysQ, partial [Rhizomicrobium sp.]|nr:3'(2'),5'-bisphosphate nucleotidase CysQ [Rhizomicrobium sp.]